MAHYSGNRKTRDVYRGSTKIGKIYRGSQLVYMSARPVTYHLNANTSFVENVAPGKSCLSPKTFNPSNYLPETNRGWSFAGWRKNSTASAAVESSVIMGSESIHLYAVYKKSVTLSYVGNGATSGSMSAQTGTRYWNNGNNAGAVFTLKTSTFAKKAYSFNQWALGSASGTKYGAGSTVTLNGDSTVYATWRAVQTVIFDGDIEPYGSSELTMPIQVGTFDLTGFSSMRIYVRYLNPNVSGQVSVQINGSQIVNISGLITGTNYGGTERTVNISGQSGNKAITITRSGHDNATHFQGSITLIP